MKHLSLATLALCAAAGALSAQTSSASATIDPSGVGCQNGAGLLTGDVAVEATATFDYDASTGVLQLTVDNTTPIVAGEANAVITEVHFNLPPGAITSATLVSQTAAGGAAPAFTLAFEPDPASAPNGSGVGCLGRFGVTLDAGNGSHGAIANASAPMISTPDPVLGPVTFEIQLDGPGASGIDANAILASHSQGGSYSTPLGMKFQGAGLGGEESGFVGLGNTCRTGLYTVGQTAVGETFDLCVTGGYGCHACVWVTDQPGPVVVGDVTIPVGLPIAAAYTLGNFGLGGAGSQFCITYEVPNNPALSGFAFYATNITYNALNLQGFQFSSAITITID